MDWADIDDDDHIILPPSKETTDKNGIKTTIKYRVEKNQRIKMTTRVRLYQFEKRIYHAATERRKTWKKFGECANLGPGPEENITYQSFDEIQMEDPNTVEEDPTDKDADIEERIKASIGAGKWRSRVAANGAGDEGDTGADGSGGTSYVPPHMRGGGGSVSLPQRDSTSRFARDEGHTLRVTNISEDTKEADLQDLFRPFGRVQRIYLAKDRFTMQSRGFAFVTYSYKGDAEKAMEKLDGYGYDHLILKVEWAKPSVRDPQSTGLSSGFVSGYGKALPQGMGK